MPLQYVINNIIIKRQYLQYNSWKNNARVICVKSELNMATSVILYSWATKANSNETQSH